MLPCVVENARFEHFWNSFQNGKNRGWSLSATTHFKGFGLGFKVFGIGLRVFWSGPEGFGSGLREFGSGL